MAMQEANGVVRRTTVEIEVPSGLIVSAAGELADKLIGGMEIDPDKNIHIRDEDGEGLHCTQREALVCAMSGLADELFQEGVQAGFKALAASLGKEINLNTSVRESSRNGATG